MYARDLVEMINTNNLINLNKSEKKMASSQGLGVSGLAASLGASLHPKDQQSNCEMQQYKDYYQDLLLKQLEYYPEIVA